MYFGDTEKLFYFLALLTKDWFICIRQSRTVLGLEGIRNGKVGIVERTSRRFSTLDELQLEYITQPLGTGLKRCMWLCLDWVGSRALY